MNKSYGHLIELRGQISLKGQMNKGEQTTRMTHHKGK